MRDIKTILLEIMVEAEVKKDEMIYMYNRILSESSKCLLMCIKSGDRWKIVENRLDFVLFVFFLSFFFHNKYYCMYLLAARPE